MKRFIVPDELRFKSASCGFECHTIEEVYEFMKYFQSIGCSFKVQDLYIEPIGKLVPLKNIFTKADVYEYLMVEF